MLSSPSVWSLILDVTSGQGDAGIGNITGLHVTTIPGEQERKGVTIAKSICPSCPWHITKFPRIKQYDLKGHAN
jgi:hypothetical protein